MTNAKRFTSDLSNDEFSIDDLVLDNPHEPRELVGLRVRRETGRPGHPPDFHGRDIVRARKALSDG